MWNATDASTRQPLSGVTVRDRFRVGVASRIFEPEPAAAAFRLGAVADALVADGATVDVVTASVPEQLIAEARDAEQGVKVSRFPVLRDKAGYVRGYVPYMSFDIPLFFRLLFGPRFDVLLVEPPPTTGFVARLACRLRNIPYVWYAADVWSDAAEIAGAPRLVVKVVRGLERFAVRGAAGIIAVSDGVKGRVQELGGRNIRVIPNGIDTETYSTNVEAPAPEALLELGITGSYVIYAGTASEWQGARVFAQAMRKVAGSHPELQIVFVGQGSEWEDIAAEAHGLRRTFGRDVVVQVPPTSPGRVAQLLAGAEGALVSIVPGKGYDFAYPTKVLAALAAGSPVLFAGDGPVAKDLKNNGLGLACAYDVGSVGEGIVNLVEADWPTSAREQRRGWVVENRSVRKSAEGAARFVLDVGARGGRK